MRLLRVSLTRLGRDQRLFQKCQLCTHRLKTIKGSEMKRTPQIDVDSRLIRNIGIIAHIDAGKTTVTERILYLAGATNTMGDVDSGNTITDFLDLERERGITIQSAAISLFWRQHRVNLIDTPGHVDFTVEVGRCVRVLDGAVTVLDASAGVQAQTITVWRQANNFSLPSIFFVNKMDKTAANFQKSVESIRARLSMQNAIPICRPLFTEEGRFFGVLDLINKQYLNCDLGNKAHWEDIGETSKRYEELMKGREELLSTLADVDDEFVEELLLQGNTNENDFNKKVISSLRRATLKRTAVPVVCGTALRCAESTRPVLDAVTRYLPSPNERNHLVSSVFGDDLSALVFKITHDKRHGRLSFVRIYTGQITNGSSVYNANRGLNESRLNVFVPHSDELQPVDVVKAGNIAVVTGLQSTITGDTLLSSENAAKSASERRHLLIKSQKAKKHSKHASHNPTDDKIDEDNDRSEVGQAVLLSGIETPDPVYFCCVEPPDAGSVRKFEKALQELVVEDPSIRVRTDELGQTIIEAMGVLHIEVIKDHLQREHGLKVFVGPLQVSYRELIDSAVVNTERVEAVLGDRKVKHECTLTLEVIPKPKSGKFTQVAIKLEETEIPFIRQDWIKAVNEGCANAALNGPVIGFPVHDLEVTLKMLHTGGGKTNPAIISACANKTLEGAFRKAGAHLVEPIMKVEITLMDAEHRTSTSGILQEISRRRGAIMNVEGGDEKSSFVRIDAHMPLADLEGFSSSIRTLTSGLGDIHMQFEGYEDVPLQSQKIIVEKMKGNM